MHSLIYDKKELQKYLDYVLYNSSFGNSTENISKYPFFVMFIARTKYLTEKQKQQYDMKNNFQFYKCLVVEKSKFIRKLNDFNINNVFDRKNKQLPIDCMSIYVTLNPRDVNKATYQLQKYLLDLSYKKHFNEMNKLEYFAYKAYHVSPLKLQRCVIDIDIDFDNGGNHKMVYNTIMEIINKIMYSVVCIVETHSGYHIYVDLSKMDNKYKQFIFQDLPKLKITCIKEINTNTDTMVVLPGTLQGGFPVRIIHIHEKIIKEIKHV